MLRCIECGGTNVEYKVWFNQEKEKVVEDCEDDEGWCVDCESLVKIELND